MVGQPMKRSRDILHGAVIALIAAGVAIAVVAALLTEFWVTTL
jgi:tetrahydromethanopterin S-methyltransferase subunit G